MADEYCAAGFTTVVQDNIFGADVARWLARAIPAGPSRLRQVEGTGREVGRDLVTGPTDDLAAAFRQTFSALGFQPEVEDADGGTLTAKLCNCPYRDSVRENPEVICRLHRGVTVGVLETLDPDARVVRFEPHDPDRAGCMVEIARGGRKNTAGASRS